MPERDKLLGQRISTKQAQASTTVTTKRFETIQKRKQSWSIDVHSQLRLHVFTFGSRYVYVTQPGDSPEPHLKTVRQARAFP